VTAWRVVQGAASRAKARSSTPAIVNGIPGV
jgi:hypothetical protein